MDTVRVNTADQPVAAISTLATELADVIKGYQAMLGKADGDLRPLIERLVTLHETHAARIHEIYRDLGGNPEEAGSFMGSVHTAIAHLRDLTGSLDATAISSIINGEERILATYADAVEAAGGHPDIQNVVADQMKVLREHVKALSA